MRSTVLSAMCLVIPLSIVCVIYIRLFSVSVITVTLLAAIFLIYGVLMALSWKSSKKAQQLQLNACSYTGTKWGIVKIAIGISAPFYLMLLLLAMIPLEHYSVWLLFFIPAMILLSLPLAVVADFCRTFLIPQKLFWSMQILVQFVLIIGGRSVAQMLLRSFLW